MGLWGFGVSFAVFPSLVLLFLSSEISRSHPAFFVFPAGNMGLLSAERTICGKNRLAVAFLFSSSSFLFLSFGGISHTLSHLGRRTRVSAFSGKIRYGIFLPFCRRTDRSIFVATKMQDHVVRAPFPAIQGKPR